MHRHDRFTKNMEAYMNITAATSRFKRIQKAADDGELSKATQLEFDLVADALRAIAAGAKDPRGLAKVAIQSFDLGFQRMPYNE